MTEHELTLWKHRARAFAMRTLAEGMIAEIDAELNRLQADQYPLNLPGENRSSASPSSSASDEDFLGELHDRGLL